MNTILTKNRVVRAQFDADTITVYQAYNKQIAEAAIKAQTFVAPPFKVERMTWIKPSFLWMMYRAGWGLKENQEHILAIKIKREGFEWALRNGALSHFESDVHGTMENWKLEVANSPVRVQWDPERDFNFTPLDYRAIQIGLSGKAVLKYIDEWIFSIEDITPKCAAIHELVKQNRLDEAAVLLPVEEYYPLPLDIRIRLNADS